MILALALLRFFKRPFWFEAVFHTYFSSKKPFKLDLVGPRTTFDIIINDIYLFAFQKTG